METAIGYNRVRYYNTQCSETITFIIPAVMRGIQWQFSNFARMYNSINFLNFFLVRPFTKYKNFYIFYTEEITMNNSAVDPRPSHKISIIIWVLGFISLIAKIIRLYKYCNILKRFLFRILLLV